MNSYWISSTKDDEGYSKINKDYVADVCVVGAGITGLSTAYYLTKNNLKVIVVDKASDIGEKASGNTTAKITLQHNLIYSYLLNSFGEDYAQKYFEANKKAIEEIKKIIDDEKIDCDYSKKSNYVYSITPSEIGKIHEEIKVVNMLCNRANNKYNNVKQNKEYAQFVTDCGLPFKIAGAIETKDQAQFHPRKYMKGLAKGIIAG